MLLHLFPSPLHFEALLQLMENTQTPGSLPQLGKFSSTMSMNNVWNFKPIINWVNSVWILKVLFLMLFGKMLAGKHGLPLSLHVLGRSGSVWNTSMEPGKSCPHQFQKEILRAVQKSGKIPLARNLSNSLIASYSYLVGAVLWETSTGNKRHPEMVERKVWDKDKRT